MYVLTSVLYVWQKGKQIFNNKSVGYNHTSSFTILQAGSTTQILLKGPWNWKHKMSSIKHFFYVKLHTAIGRDLNGWFFRGFEKKQFFSLNCCKAPKFFWAEKNHILSPFLIIFWEPWLQGRWWIKTAEQ